MKQIQPGRARAPRLYENQEGNAGGQLRMQQAMRKKRTKETTRGFLSGNREAFPRLFWRIDHRIRVAIACLIQSMHGINEKTRVRSTTQERILSKEATRNWTEQRASSKPETASRPFATELSDDVPVVGYCHGRGGARRRRRLACLFVRPWFALLDHRQNTAAADSIRRRGAPRRDGSRATVVLLQNVPTTSSSSQQQVMEPLSRPQQLKQTNHTTAVDAEQFAQFVAEQRARLAQSAVRNEQHASQECAPSRSPTFSLHTKAQNSQHLPASSKEGRQQMQKLFGFGAARLLGCAERTCCLGFGSWAWDLFSLP